MDLGRPWEQSSGGEDLRAKVTGFLVCVPSFSCLQEELNRQGAEGERQSFEPRK